MLALLQSRWGAPSDVLRLENIELAPLQPGEVRVKILASPIDPMDLLQVRGLYPIKPELPAIGGAEGVGEIIETRGPANDSLGRTLAIGDRVLLPIRFGCWRTHAQLAADTTLRLPSGIDPEQACMLRVNPPTAAIMLEESGLSRGQSFIHAPASGSVGQCLIQLGKARGLQSINVLRRASQAQRVEALGGDVIVSSPEKLAEFRPTTPIHAAFDGWGGSMSSELARTLSPGASLVSYGAMSRQAPQIQLGDLVFRGVTMRGFWLLRWAKAHGAIALDRIIDGLAQHVEAGTLRTHIEARYPLSAFAAAMEHARSTDRSGRILLLPNAPD